MKKSVIEFKNFNFKYHVQSSPTLKDINLTIYQGEKVLIVGPSGSGKSTIGNCINGLIPHVYKGDTSGDLIIEGIDVKNSSVFELSKKVGTVLQDPDGQFLGLNVGEDIAYVLENNMEPLDIMKQKVLDVSKLVDMDNMLNVNPFELSGGQKQRVGLAGIMVNDVDILLFDEPLASLDPKTGEVAIELIDNLHKKDKTIIIIEHRLEDVLHCSVDRIVVVNDGCIIADDTPDNILKSDILIKHGIREPLYLTACKYANVNLNNLNKIDNVNNLDISKIKDNLNTWYKANKKQAEEHNKDIILKIDNVNFSYESNKKILNNINCNIYSGEMLSIIGKNGAGKSTLSKIIVGFEKQDSGNLYLNETEISKLNVTQRAKDIGIVLQNPNQMISKNMIYDEVALGLVFRKVPDEEIKERVTKVLDICGLSPYISWPISALSYGQKKRVTIASILVLNPKIIILDEPTAGQDFYHYTEIMKFLEKLNKNGQTIVLITHDMHLMLEYTNRAIALCDSEKIADKESYKVLCDQAIVERTNLKETSLFRLAKMANISDPEDFVKCFIDYDREVRRYEN